MRKLGTRNITELIRLSETLKRHTSPADFEGTFVTMAARSDNLPTSLF
ncbi:hypothetical protein HFN80_33595 [Rhizobium laguerreae]|nr:hypothetical protein [Rhizobium laguerreae]